MLGAGLLAGGFASPGLAQEQPMVFASIADVHCLDQLLSTPVPQDFLDRLDSFLQGVAAFNPSFVIMPGDLGSQRWWSADDPYCALPGTTNERVKACADIAYPALKARMALHGLGAPYVAMGDHEIGDNNWPVGVRSDAVPVFKDAFARHFTENPDGSSRFGGSLGGVPLRPIGTPYERTSYAFVAGPALFVALDEFRQDDPARVAGRRGTVAVTVGDDGHLQWLEALLAAARQDPAIRHILVYGHVPVLSPVRAVASSDIYLEPRQYSAFWGLMRKYGVDTYVAGEVHATTVIKDFGGPTLQVVHGSGCGGVNGFLVGRLYADRIEFENEMPQPPPAPLSAFAPEGTLVIDKTNGRFRTWTTGQMLKPIDPRGLVVRYPFDGDPAGTVTNLGSFGPRYDATPYHIAAPAGSDGSFVFSDVDGSLLQSKGVNPISGEQPRTVSVWAQTSRDSGGAYLYPVGALWASYGAFRLFVAHGVLGLELDQRTRMLANQGDLRLDDGQWHHLAVTFPGRGALADDVGFYVDGQAFAPAVALGKRIYTETTVDQVSVGGRTGAASLEGWTGSLRDFALWASALAPGMVRAVSDCAARLQYSAGDMESLFRLYRSRRGSYVLQGLTWRYATGLTGEVGVCAPSVTSAGSTLVLDGTGAGVVGSPP